MLAGTLLGVALGHFPRGLRAPKPQWWRALAILSITVTVVLAFMPPTGASITDAVIQGRVDSSKSVPVYVRVAPSTVVKDDQGIVFVSCTDMRSDQVTVQLRGTGEFESAVRDLSDGTPIIVNVLRGESDVIFNASNVVSIQPLITLPYIIGLETSARILFFHVPMAWISVIAYLIAMIFGVKTIRSGLPEHDDVVVATSAIGTVYAILATITGAVWAKFTWGAFWNWDPRQTSIFILILIYAAYFLLRSAIDDEQRRASLSAAYSIVAFATVPFLVFVLPRLLPGLHPGSADDVNAGPLISPKSDDINPTKQMVFTVSLFGFTLLFYWLVNLVIRTRAVARTVTTKESR